VTAAFGPIAAAAILLAAGLAAHAALAVRPSDGRRAALGLAGGALAMAAAVVGAAALADQVGPAALVAALVPLLGLPALFPERGRAGEGSTVPIVTAALAAVLGGALPLVADLQVASPDPALARVALALVVLHVCLVGAIVPAHLWSLGLASRVSSSSLAALLGLGDLAALATLDAALSAYPWLLGVVGARPLLATVGAVGLGLSLIGLLGERRPVRAVLLIGQLPAAAAWLVLASGAAGGQDAAIALLLGRALGLATALLALDALARMPARSWRTPHRARLLGPAQLALWIGVGGLLGLPPTAGFLAGRAALETLAPERPDLALALLLATGLALVGARSLALALLLAPAEASPAGAGPAEARTSELPRGEASPTGAAPGETPTAAHSPVEMRAAALPPAEEPAADAVPVETPTADLSPAGASPAGVTSAEMSAADLESADLAAAGAQAADEAGAGTEAADEAIAGARDATTEEALAGAEDATAEEATGAAEESTADAEAADGPTAGGESLEGPAAGPASAGWRPALVPLGLGVASLILGLAGGPLLAALRAAAGRLGG